MVVLVLLAATASIVYAGCGPDIGFNADLRVSTNVATVGKWTEGELTHRHISMTSINMRTHIFYTTSAAITLTLTRLHAMINTHFHCMVPVVKNWRTSGSAALYNTGKLFNEKTGRFTTNIDGYFACSTQVISLVME